MHVPANLPVTRLLRSVLSLRCPICLEGVVFGGLFDAGRRCEVCGYFFSRESGYFAGSVFLGYGATLGGAAGLWLLLSRFLGMGWDVRVLIALLVFVLVFSIWFFRYSRMLWMALDLYLNPPVTEDFEPRGR